MYHTPAESLTSRNTPATQISFGEWKQIESTNLVRKGKGCVWVRGISGGRWIWLKHRQKILKELEKQNKTRQQIMFQWWKVLASLYEDLSLGPCSHISDSQLPLTPAWRKLTLSFELQRYPHTCEYIHNETHEYPCTYIHKWKTF